MRTKRTYLAFNGKTLQVENLGEHDGPPVRASLQRPELSFIMREEQWRAQTAGGCLKVDSTVEPDKRYIVRQVDGEYVVSDMPTIKSF